MKPGAIVALVAAAGVAHAEPAAAPAAPDEPDPAVQDASDANLESTADRRGLTLAAAAGGGVIIGFGIKDSVGRGGSLSLRLGHVATRRTVITFELGATAALHRPATMSGTSTNTNVNLAAGAQYYVNRSLWLRLAGGAGVYTGRDVALSSGGLGTVTLIGPVVVGGIGVDLLRIKFGVLGIEFATSAMINGDGLLVASGAALGVAFD